MELSAVVPVYNEEEAVRETLEKLKEVLEQTDLQFEIIAIDDGSTDRSYEILQGVRGIKVLKNPYNLGYGATLKRGLKEAQGKYFLMLDSDGSYPVKQVPRLLKHMRDFDMVVGERDRSNVPFLRKPAKFILRALVNFVSDQHIPDENSGMRVFQRDMGLEFYNLYPKRFSFTITITLAAITRGYTVKFEPIDYHKRKGMSSMKPINFIHFLPLIMRVATYFKPFRVFTALSVVTFAFALLTFLYTFLVVGRVMDIAVIVIGLASVQIFLFGLIADMIVKKD